MWFVAASNVRLYLAITATNSNGSATMCVPVNIFGGNYSTLTVSTWPLLVYKELVNSMKNDEYAPWYLTNVEEG